jgi:hypothetical protein
LLSRCTWLVLLSACGRIGPPAIYEEAPPLTDAEVQASMRPLRVPPDGGALDSGFDAGVDAGEVILAHEHPAIEAAIHAWAARHEQHGDVPDADVLACASRFDDMQILILEGRAFRRECDRCSTEDESDVCDRIGRIYACAPWEEPGRIVVDAALADSERTLTSLVVHEAIHHLGLCSGAGADLEHADEMRWCGRRYDCIEGAATATARDD